MCCKVDGKVCIWCLRHYNNNETWQHVLHFWSLLCSRMYMWVQTSQEVCCVHSSYGACVCVCCAGSHHVCPSTPYWTSWMIMPVRGRWWPRRWVIRCTESWWGTAKTSKPKGNTWVYDWVQHFSVYSFMDRTHFLIIKTTLSEEDRYVWCDNNLSLPPPADIINTENLRSMCFGQMAPSCFAL